MRFCRLLALSFFLIICLASSAQKPDVDSLFAAARDYAFNQKNYPLALSNAKHALRYAPAYIDIIVFTGRVHGWIGEVDSAKRYFEQSLALDSAHLETLVAYSDLQFGEAGYGQALALADRGLRKYPQHTGLLLRKARVLHAMRRYDEASLVASQLITLDPGSVEARRLLEEILDSGAANKLEVQYQYLHSSKQFEQPWHLAAVGYSRKINAGVYAARVYMARRFGQTGTQFELEAYPRISKRLTAFATVAYSAAETVFPEWRFGVSLFAALPKAFEMEVGYRRLQFNTASNILTFSLGKYYRSWLFGARTFIVPSDSITTHSTGVFARRYFGRRNDFIGLSLTSGISPDERGTNVLFNKVNLLETFRAEIQGRWSFTTLNSVQYGLALISQEYGAGLKDRQLQLSVGYARRF